MYVTCEGLSVQILSLFLMYWKSLKCKWNIYLYSQKVKIFRFKAYNGERNIKGSERA